MKKSLLIIAAVAMSFVACSKEEIQTVSKGMTLSANVADDNTKATIDKNSETEKWDFSWETNDVVSVKSPTDKIYDFTYDGTSFKCETAEPEAGNWTAVYPKEYKVSEISFEDQWADPLNPFAPVTTESTLKSAMQKYCLEGNCPSDVSATLSMTMFPKCAILKVTNNSGKIQALKLIDSSFGVNAYHKINSEGNVVSSRSSESGELASVKSDGNVYYIAIPVPDVAVKLNGTKDFTSGKKLEAGKVYNVTLE